jgi:prepilin-type N-terminal cleavage/methylation domain-containing protein
MITSARGTGGFSLVELLVAMVIIAILATIAIPRFDTARTGSFRATVVSDLRNLSTAQELHHRTGSTYATDAGALDWTPSTGVEFEITEANASGWAARAHHRALPQETCGVFVGQADPSNAAPALRQDEIRCQP